MNKPVHIDIAELEKGARAAFNDLLSRMRASAPDADAVANLDVQELFVEAQIQASLAVAKAIMLGHEPIRIAASLGNCLGNTVAGFCKNVDPSGCLADVLYDHVERAIHSTLIGGTEDGYVSFHVPVIEGGSA